MNRQEIINLLNSIYNDKYIYKKDISFLSKELLQNYKIYVLTNALQNCIWDMKFIMKKT